jgi:ribosomal protein S13
MTSPYTYDRSKNSKNFGHTSGLGSRHDSHLADEKNKPVKGITTDNNAFVKGTQIVESVFFDLPYVVAVFRENRISLISQVPRTFESLIKIKGIGKKSAIKILEVLNG